MKLLLSALLVSAAAAFAPAPVTPATSALQETSADLAVLAKKLNPIVGFWDPLNLAEESFWETTPDATIGFLREAEIKHGRIAMFAFVGYIVHANGIHFPWAMQMDGTQFPEVSNAPEAWDSISDSAKLQIFGFIGFLEVWREINGDKHYMKGGKPGEFPAFDATIIPGGALNLYDPFGWHKNRSEADKASGLVKEINNGRLAMIGIMGFLSEGKIEGSVPALKGIIPAYAGEVMAPFNQSILPHF